MCYKTLLWLAFRLKMLHRCYNDFINVFGGNKKKIHIANLVHVKEMNKKSLFSKHFLWYSVRLYCYRCFYYPICSRKSCKTSLAKPQKFMSIVLGCRWWNFWVKMKKKVERKHFPQRSQTFGQSSKLICNDKKKNKQKNATCERKQERRSRHISSLLNQKMARLPFPTPPCATHHLHAGFFQRSQKEKQRKRRPLPVAVFPVITSTSARRPLATFSTA